MLVQHEGNTIINITQERFNNWSINNIQRLTDELLSVCVMAGGGRRGGHMCPLTGASTRIRIHFMSQCYATLPCCLAAEQILIFFDLFFSFASSHIAVRATRTPNRTHAQCGANGWKGRESKIHITPLVSHLRRLPNT